MLTLLSTGIDLLSAAVFLLPLLLLAQFRQKDRRRIVLLLLFALCLSAVLSVTGVPSVYTWTLDPQVNLLPFVDVLQSPGHYGVNSALNVLLFLPLGFLLPVLWPKLRSWKGTLCTGLGVSLAIELLQLFSHRLTDVDDLITNTLGCALGFLLARRLFRLDRPESFAPPLRGELLGTILLVFVVALFLQHLLSDALWGVLLESPLWEQIR